MNLYGKLSQLKTQLGISGSSEDTDLLFLMDVASRQADDYCNRYFYSETATYYFESFGDMVIFQNKDLLSASAVAGDDDGDETWGETWTEGTHFEFIGRNNWPKWGMQEKKSGSLSFPNRVENYFQIAGTWGYGDGESASPWLANGTTATVADAATTTVTSSDGTALEAGQTILVGSEQMYIESISVNDLTVTRAVNGTTGAAHAGAAVSTAKYPKPIEMATIWLCGQTYRDRERMGLQNWRFADYSGQVMFPKQLTQYSGRMMDAYRRATL